jgi:hypothetical protein
MTTILIIEKTGTVKPLSVKTFSEEDLFKKAGFKSNEGFKKHTTWLVKVGETGYAIDLYGKTNGRAGQENKYDFPPPVDSVLFFGSCVLVNRKSTGETANFSPKEWEIVYEKLFGGFRDLGEEDSETESDDSDDSENVPKTKDGYVKDGFVVDDDEDFEDDSYDIDKEEPVKKSRKPAQNTVVKRKPAKKTKHVKVHPEIVAPQESIVLQISEPPATENYLDCTDELVEEDYV